MTETNDLPFVSVNKGAMHSCGHDGHAAMLLGIAKLFSEKTEQLKGTLVCIFQHAEEVPPGGAIEMVRAGVMEGVDEIYGIHLSSNYPTGKFGVVSGPLTSATDRFDIKVIGKGGHSSLPEQCVDPIVAAAQIVTGLQNIVARRISAYDTGGSFRMPDTRRRRLQHNTGRGYNNRLRKDVLQGTEKQYACYDKGNIRRNSRKHGREMRGFL